MNKEIILLVGPPGSGKTTYRSSIYNSIYINQDEMGKEKHLKVFNTLLSDGCNMVIDRMNFSKEQRERYLKPAKEAGYKTKIVVFHVPSETCLTRCISRKNHPTIKNEKDASKAINFFFSKYERVEDNEADEVVRLGWDEEKEAAIICDLDGTLCNIDHRMSFLSGKVTDNEETQKKDWASFFSNIPNDKVNKWCAEIIWNMEGKYPIIYCSGRPDNYKKATQEWLDINHLKGDKLFMRRRGDYRKDDIVKEIILEFELKTRYNILFWLDDRKQVVDKIRSHGIVVLACCEGNY